MSRSRSINRRCPLSERGALGCVPCSGCSCLMCFFIAADSLVLHMLSRLTRTAFSPESVLHGLLSHQYIIKRHNRGQSCEESRTQVKLWAEEQAEPPKG